MLRRVGLLLVLLGVMVVATAGAVQATTRLVGPRPASDSSSSILDRLWNWLTHLFPAGPASQSGMTSTWDAEGSHLDPNGNS